MGGKFDKFDTIFNAFCILGVFLEGDLGFWGAGGGESSQEIAGNNTGLNVI